MSGIYFIIGRRMKLQAHAALEQGSGGPDTAPPTEAPGDTATSENAEPSEESAESEHE